MPFAGRSLAIRIARARNGHARRVLTHTHTHTQRVFSFPPTTVSLFIIGKSNPGQQTVLVAVRRSRGHETQLFQKRQLSQLNFTTRNATHFTRTVKTQKKWEHRRVS